MADDTPYSKRELDTFQKEMFRRLDSQDMVLARIESTQGTNQIEIALIKDVLKDYPDMKVAVSSLTNYKSWIIGSIVTVITIGGIVVYLLNDKIDTKIAVGIDQAFNSRFSKIQVINNN